MNRRLFCCRNLFPLAEECIKMVKGILVVMEPIYDRMGRVKGWLRKGEVLNLQGQYLAFCRNESVITFRGKHIGWFSQGTFRDQQGNPVAFIKGAFTGMAMPALSAIPAQPAISAYPAMPAIPATPARPARSLSWSSGEVELYFRGEGR